MTDANRLLHLTLALALLAATSCSNSIEDDVNLLYEGGAKAQEARQRLSRARPIDTRSLIEAFRDTRHPAYVRLDLGAALVLLFEREENRRVLYILIEAIADREAEIRAAIAETLRGLRPPEAVGPLLHQFVRETDDRVRVAILAALEEITVEDGPEPFSWHLNTDLLATEERPDDKLRFTRALQQVLLETVSDSLRTRSLEWLELLADEKAAEAWRWLEKGDRRWAARELIAARDMVPDSKNLNWQLGHLYYRMGERRKALATLREAGLLIAAAALPTKPRMDGDLSDTAWLSATPTTDFFRCEWSGRASPDTARTELLLGYHQGDLYVGYRAFEDSTAALTALAVESDDRAIARDDGIELFLDVDHDQITYYHVAANSLAAVTDQFNSGNSRLGDLQWDGGVEAAAKVSDGEWSLELRLPAHRMGNRRITAGDIWGFNAARIRTSDEFSYAPWAPTYGSAHRPDRFGYLLFD